MRTCDYCGALADDSQVACPACGKPLPPVRPVYGTVGSKKTRALAKVGIAFALIGGLLGLVAYFSYRRWQQGYLDKPRFAWYAAALWLTLLPLVGILSLLGFFPMSEERSLSGALSLGALVLSVVVGIATFMLLPASPVVTRHPRRVSTARQVPGKGKPQQRDWPN